MILKAIKKVVKCDRTSLVGLIASNSEGKLTFIPKEKIQLFRWENAKVTDAGKIFIDVPKGIPKRDFLLEKRDLETYMEDNNVEVCNV